MIPVHTSGNHALANGADAEHASKERIFPNAGMMEVQRLFNPALRRPLPKE